MKETVTIYTYKETTDDEPWEGYYFCDLSGDKSGEGCQHDGGELYEVPHPYKLARKGGYGKVILDVRGFICSLWVTDEGTRVCLIDSWGEIVDLELKENL